MTRIGDMSSRSDDAPRVSVVISTYNRSPGLARALRALASQTGGVAYEVVVVDNNSNDDTRGVVSRFARDTGGRLIRYAFEPRQGLSYGRNTGIGLALGPIIAFTDDDVTVAPDWVATLAQVFAAHPGIDYVGGRVLPVWLAPPPSWLTRSMAHWSPLALQDYGETELVSSRDRAVCLVGASLAFRRSVFDTIGPFTPALGRIRDGIGSTEDHELQLRAWRAGLKGLYAPALVAYADVTPDRMTTAYHRRWHHGHGRHCALMKLRERVPEDMGPLREPADLIMVFGSPAFVYGDVVRAASDWIRARLTRGDALFYAHRLRHLSSYLRTSYNAWSSRDDHAILPELIRFSRAYLRKRLSRVAARPARV
jgi:glycosyltransferase involved in cell wall biosynthesis